MKIKSDEGAELLMQAIVEHAVVDYQNAISQIAKCESMLLDGENEKLRLKLCHAKSRKAECERFFYSDYCFGFTGISGEELIEMIRKKGKRAKKKNNGKN